MYKDDIQVEILGEMNTRKNMNKYAHTLTNRISVIDR